MYIHTYVLCAPNGLLYRTYVVWRWRGVGVRLYSWEGNGSRGGKSVNIRASDVHGAEGTLGWAGLRGWVGAISRQLATFSYVCTWEEKGGGSHDVCLPRYGGFKDIYVHIPLS